MSIDVPPRVYLLVNESAGAGHGASAVSRIERSLEVAFGSVEVSVVSDHPAAAERARGLASESGGTATLFVGGGGGTLRGVIEGIAASSNGRGLPGPERVRIAPLRMGSGNLLAKELGVPRDPIEACERLVTSVRAGRVEPCCIGRYDFERENGELETRYAAGLAGFGQLGRVPGDLERWHARFPKLRRRMARLAGIERWNDVEYAGATLLRTWRAALAPAAVEKVEVRRGDEVSEVRLLAGVVMSFPIATLPFDAGTSLGEEKLTISIVPYRSRTQAAGLVLAPRRHARAALRFDVVPGRSVEIALSERERVEMFLDEDPIELYRKVTISVAGSLSFVPAR